MMSFLRSFVDLLEPPGLVWLLLTIMLGLTAWKRRLRQMWLPGLAWLILVIAGSLPLPHALLADLENDWPQVDLATLPEADAIVMLGGGLEPSLRETGGMHVLVGADRLFTALELARQGKAKELVVSGGVYSREGGGTVYEADGARDWIRSAWPAITTPVRSLGGCADTRDEAVRVAALAREHGWQRVLLVTSAFHMSRSKAVFEKAGVPGVVPVPCNYLSASMRGRAVTWFSIPNASHLGVFELWMHEVIGWWGYRLRGWV